MRILIDGVEVQVSVKPLDRVDGEFSPADLKIYINQNVSQQIQKRILFHELTHAVIHISSRGLVDYALDMTDTDKIEEMLVEQIGERLFRVLSENKELRKYLFGGEK